MIFFSQLLNVPIYDDRNEFLGKCTDVVAGEGAEGYPSIKGIITLAGKSAFYIPFKCIEVFGPAEITLGLPDPRKAYIECAGEILLGRDLLDKQIFDVKGIRVIRVNDLQLMKFEGVFNIVGVDISAAAIFRRIGIPLIGSKIFIPQLLDWQHMDFTKESDGMKLKMGYNKLTKLHPADIANMIENLSLQDGSKVIESFDADTAADVLAEVEPKYKDILLEKLDSKNLSQMIDKMDDDEAADVIQDLSHHKKSQVIGHLQSTKAAHLNRLASYEQDDAGGLMTTHYFFLSENLTVSEALKEMQKKTNEHKSIYHIFVVNDQHELLGVVSVRTFLFADKRAKIAKHMSQPVGVVSPTTETEEVARIMTKYNLLSVPVVDEDKKLLGVVTVDDVMRSLLPAA